MINGLEGIPGSGKSYEAVVYHVLAALQKGRKVITNLPLILDMFTAIDPAYRDLIEIRRVCQPVRGTWDADAANRDEDAFRLFEDGHADPAPVSVPLFGHVWDFYTTWKGADGNGPLFVIDECHVSFPKIGTSDSVIQWFKLHRHFNVDVLLMSQSFRDICQSIATLMAILVKVRKADILGKVDHYIRKVHGGYRGAVISTEERKYKPEYFPLYRSHTQGNSVAETSAQDVRPFIVRFRKWTRVVIFVGLCIFVGSFFLPKSKPTAAAAAKPPWLDKAVAEYKTSPPIGDEPVLANADVVESVSSDVPEPYQTKTLHMTGRLTMGDRTLYTFTVAQNGLAVASITDKDLAKAGYRFTPLTDCAGVLHWGNKSRALTCDAPQVSMGMAGAAGALGRDASSALH